MKNGPQFPSPLRPSRPWLLCMQLTTMLTGCSSIEAIHDPLYQASAHTSTISASASASWGRSINKITITVTEGRAGYCRTLSGIAPGAIPCRENASRVVHTCEFPDSPKDAICTYPLATHSATPFVSFGDPLRESHGDRRTQFEPRLITYSAMLESQSALGINYDFTDEITYAAGDYPLDLARPIWWHRQKNLDSKIDIALFPDDTDYPGYDSFLRDVDTVIKGAFFNAGQSFSKLYTENRTFVNLWAAPLGVFTQGCQGYDPQLPHYRSPTIENALRPIAVIMDGKALFHRGSFDTCSDIAYPGGGWATMDVAIVKDGRNKAGWDPANLFVHESGHFVHGFGDEYPGGGNYAVNPCKNVFPSKTACDNALSAPPSAADAICEKITDGNRSIDVWHRVTSPPGPYEDIMDNKIDSPDWLTDCRYCVLKTFKNCENGKCFF